MLRGKRPSLFRLSGFEKQLNRILLLNVNKFMQLFIVHNDRCEASVSVLLDVGTSVSCCFTLQYVSEVNTALYWIHIYICRISFWLSFRLFSGSFKSIEV